jgi:cAMP-dependent protein kinase regulator
LEDQGIRSDLERAAEEARLAGREAEALRLLEELVGFDLRAGNVAKAVSTYQRIVLWRPQQRELHQRLAERIGATRDAGPELPRSALFQGIPAAQLPEILQVMRPRKFAAGAEIVREGDPGESLFLITEGKASVHTKDSDGRLIPLATLGSGDFFGEVSLLTSRPRTATVRAETGVEVLELGRDRLASLRERFPEIDSSLADFHELRAQKTVESILAQRTKKPQ